MTAGQLEIVEAHLPWGYAIPVIVPLSLASWAVVIAVATAMWQAI